MLDRTSGFDTNLPDAWDIKVFDTPEEFDRPCDGSINPTADGAPVGYRTRDGQESAHAWKRAYAARGWTGRFRADNYTDDRARSVVIILASHLVKRLVVR